MVNKLVEEIIKPILEANPKIKKVVGIYGGRFQPFGPHHYKTYKWLEKQVDEAYITTSNIKKPPRHPMNFKEKVRHMTKMGVKANFIVEEKTPYVANNVMKKFNKETTAVVYIFGKKDAGRLKGGTKKSGGKTYYQDYKQNKNNLESYETHGYILTAPHVTINVGGKEVSGTAMRELLGSPKIDDKKRKKLFKQMFGYYNDGVFKMMTNKFKKLFDWTNTKKRPLLKKFKDGKDKELIHDVENWLKKGSKKDRAIKLKLSKLYTKAFKQMPGSPAQEKTKKEIEKLRNQLSEDIFMGYPDLKGLEKKLKKVKKARQQTDSDKEYQYSPVDEDINVPIKVGDTVLMGKFKNKKVVVKTIGWNEKGDMTINGKSASKFRLMKQNEDVKVVKKNGKDGGDYREYDPESNSDWEEPYSPKKKLKKEQIEDFLTTIDFQKLVESTQTNATTADDGPNIFYKKSSPYQKRGHKQAGKLGWEVVNYIMGDSDILPNDYPIYPEGPVPSVSWLPAGGGGNTPNNQVDLTGNPSWNKWLQHMRRLSQLVGYELIDYLTDKEDVVDDTKETQKIATDEEPPETKKKTKNDQHDEMETVKESTFSKDWWKEIIEEEQILLDEGIKFKNFLKDWSKKSKQPLDKINKSMNNKNTFAVAKLNDFSVDKVFDSAKKGFTTFQKVMNYVPDKVSGVLHKTKFGKKKDKALEKVDDYLKKHPKLKRIMGVAAGAAITYAWTKMTFVGDPEYDLDLSAAASAAALGDYTMSDLFSGELGTKFLVLTAVGAGTGLTMPYTKVLGTAGTFAAGIGFGAYRAYKKRKAKQQEPTKKDSGLPDKVKNPNPNGRRKEIGLQGAVNWIAKNRGNKAAKKFVQKLRTKNIKEGLLMEGGAYGHMAHPFDDKDLTFGDLKKIITDGLGGTLNREDNVTEKLDGQNIMVSWKDGKLIAARNKGHIKNGGKTALDTKGIMSKFKGRGDIRNAFVYAMKDLEKAIKSLSQKQKDKIFNNGYNFMNLEVMWPKSANVVDYDKAELVFHGALKYNDAGVVKGEVKGSARILAGMIKQRNKNIGKKYKIGKPNFLTVPKHQDFGKMKKKFLGKLQKLRNEFSLKDSDTLALYHQKWWESFIHSHMDGVVDYGGKTYNTILKGLTKRWAFFDKSYKIPMIKKDIEDEVFLDWVLKFDKKNHAKQVKENMKPFEVLFFEVGAEILKNVKGFMAANPSKAVQGMRKRIDKAISDVKAGGDLKKLNTLKLQLDKLEAIGGTDAIVPSEGIVFKYKGNTYKFTGAFAPVNQIAGLINF
tara:strand:- start:317 stop:4162 length:3846 start_codon:yes stop_codon:yes gene_type:complete